MTRKPSFKASALCAGLLCVTPALFAADEFELPPVELPQDRLSALPEVHVERFELEGSTLYTEQLQKIAAPYTGREITAEELQELRYKLSRFYVEQGHINSGVIIPDQAVEDGIVVLQVIEGKLTGIEVSGNKHLTSSYLSKRIRPDADEVLNTKQLQERLQILQQNVVVERFNAELGPGLRPGEAVLEFDVTERERPYDIGAEFNNHRSPSVGSYRFVLDAKHHSLSGHGDVLSARYGLTQGLNDYMLGYSRPVNSRNTTVNVRAESSDSEVVSEPFDVLDVKSEATTLSAGVTHPVYHRYTEDFHYKLLELGLAMDKRHSKTSLLGEPFSFSPGVPENGESDLSVLRLTQNWLDRSRERVVAFYSSFGFGLDMWDATIHDGAVDAEGRPLPDGEFISWIGQFRWIQRFPELFNGKLKNSQLWFRTDIQWSDDDLLPLEKFAIGGVNTVRGYRENQLTRDRGAVLSLEWQVPVNDSGNLRLAPFVDYGWGKNVDQDTPDPKTLSSIGLGILWDPTAYLQTELYWGHALRDVEQPEDSDIQDDGIHFSIRLNFDPLFARMKKK